MKKIYLVGLAFALLTASCDDVLEKTSSTQLPTIDAIRVWAVTILQSCCLAGAIRIR